MMDPQQAMPPELMQMMQGQGDPGADPGADPNADPNGNGGSPEDQPIDILRQMIQMASQYMEAEPDEVDKGQMAKILAQLQSVIAKDQQDKDKILGNPAASRILRKQ